MRVHRSFIVSLKNVRGIRKKHIQLDNVKIPVGDTYTDSVHAWITGM